MLYLVVQLGILLRGVPPSIWMGKKALLKADSAYMLLVKLFFFLM